MLSVKEGGIKYHFFSFWYDMTWDWTLVPWTIGEHFTVKKTFFYAQMADMKLTYVKLEVFWMITAKHLNHKPH